MSKSVKSRLTPLLLLVLAIVLFATNPTEKKFKEYLKVTMEKKANESGELPGSIMELFSESASWLINLNTTRKNYLFFSVYTVNAMGEKKSFVGVLNNFIPL